MKVANSQTYVIAGVNAPKLLLRESTKRVGLTIYNNNAAAIIKHVFGSNDVSIGIPIPPNGSRTLDFCTPVNALYVSSDTANATVIIEEITEE